MPLNTFDALAASPLPQFRIQAVGPVSLQFLDAGIHSFHEALLYIRKLPYERISDPASPLLVFGEGRGTCSTKHMLLATLAEESGYDVRLMLGIFKMGADTVPLTAPVLAAAGLDYIPEAHCYLQWAGKRYDFTIDGSDPVHFEETLLHEQELKPEGATETKLALHRAYLEAWLKEKPEVKLSLDELWAAREACVAAISVGINRKDPGVLP